MEALAVQGRWRISEAGTEDGAGGWSGSQDEVWGSKSRPLAGVWGLTGVLLAGQALCAPPGGRCRGKRHREELVGEGSWAWFLIPERQCQRW